MRSPVWLWSFPSLLITVVRFTGDTTGDCTSYDTTTSLIISNLWSGIALYFYMSQQCSTMNYFYHLWVWNCGNGDCSLSCARTCLLWCKYCYNIMVKPQLSLKGDWDIERSRSLFKRKELLFYKLWWRKIH